jgi:hypothetical protein
MDVFHNREGKGGVAGGRRRCAAILGDDHHRGKETTISKVAAGTKNFFRPRCRIV